MTHNRIVSIVDDDSDIAELFYETLRGSLISLVFGLDVSFRETYGTVDDVAMTNLDSDRGPALQQPTNVMELATLTSVNATNTTVIIHLLNTI